MFSNPRDISVLRRWMAHFGKDILITAWLFRLLIGGVSRVRAGVKWSLRNSRYIKLLQKLRVATVRWRQNVTNKEKATNILAIIMEELNMPKNSTIGDIALALNIVDPDGEIMKMLKPYLRNAIIDEIKSKM